MESLKNFFQHIVRYIGVFALFSKFQMLWPWLQGFIAKAE
jgi:hypothetical protein